MSKHTETTPLVSIVLLNWNGLEDTKICLEHVRKIDYSNFEIIVVDNGSTQNQKEYLSKVKDIIYVDNPTNRGFTGGHIDGLKKARGEYILLLNNDAVIDEDYIMNALPHFKDPEVAAIGGRAYFWNNDHALFDRTAPFYSYQEIDIYTGEAKMLQSDHGTIQEVNNVSGSAVIIRKNVINEIGYLYEPFFAYFEETDLFARMKRAGYKVLYDPSLRIWHKNGASSGASDGSSFFFYQIFRNRFIFAMRNFEPWFLRRFLLNYFKAGLKSTLLLWSRKSRVMHKAYFKASLYNMSYFLKFYSSRRRLKLKLGISTYNRQLFQEQTGVSVVIDCLDCKKSDLKNIENKIYNDKNPLHEYILVIPSRLNGSSSLKGNIRYVQDRGYFKSHPINLGCLAARFSWMIVCNSNTIPDVSQTHSDIAATIETSKSVIEYSSGYLEPYIALKKSYFEKVGGMGNEKKFSANILKIVRYAKIDKQLISQLSDPSSDAIEYLPISKILLLDIKQKRKLDNAIQKEMIATWWTKLNEKYYRLYQITTTIKWIFVFNIPARLKLARIKNVFLSVLKLDRKDLALELQHMRNEVIIYGGHYSSFSEQQKNLEPKLKKALESPTDIPIFIICFERVDSLKELVTWLEKIGQQKIIFIDNDSTYQPLLDYYEKTPYQVLRLYRNLGQTTPWSLSIIRSLVPDDFYIVSDPDIIPVENCPDDTIKYFVNLHKRFLAYQKVGFGLKTNDLPNHYPLNGKSSFGNKR